MNAACRPSCSHSVWSSLDLHPPKYQEVEAYGDEPAYRLELRTCSRCKSTFSRVAEKAVR